MVKDKAERIKGEESQDKTLKAAAIYLKQQFQDINNLKADRLQTTDINGKPHYIKISPWKDDLGLDWLVVLVIPESDFMAQVNANTHTTILLCLGALGLATILGLYTSRWITQPILRLNRASEAIPTVVNYASGEFDQQVEIPSVNELGSLAVSFNRCHLPICLVLN
jgi:methyl-accepting chemotaxis protein